MKKIILLSAACLFIFLFNSFATANTFETKFGTIKPVDSNFISGEIVLTCDENFQKGEKRFQAFISSEYVWAYRNSGKFINLLFGYKTTSNGFRIEVLEKGLDGRSPKYYNFYDKNNSNSRAILSGKVVGYKKRSNQNWYSCGLNYLEPYSEVKQGETGSVSVRELRRKLYLLKTFNKLQKRAIAQLGENNHPVKVYLDFQRHKELLKKDIGELEASAKESKQPIKNQKKVLDFEQVQQQELDKLTSQNKLLSKKLAKSNSSRLVTEKELKVIKEENASLKDEILTLKSEKPKIKNQKNYDPSDARLLMPEESHGYLDKFDRNSLGLQTTEQIVVLIDQIISLDKKNRQLRIKQGELKSKIQASDLKISELKMSLENISLKEPETNNSKIKGEINWETDCRVGLDEPYRIAFGKTRRPQLSGRARCASEQHYQCWYHNFIHEAPSDIAKTGHRLRREAERLDLSTYLTIEPTEQILYKIENLYMKSITHFEKALIELQERGASCSGPLKWQ